MSFTPTLTGSAKASSVPCAKSSCVTFSSSSAACSRRGVRCLTISMLEKTPALFVHEISVASLTERRSASAGASSTCSRPDPVNAARHAVAKSPSGFSFWSVATTLPACDDCSAVTRFA